MDTVFVNLDICLIRIIEHAGVYVLLDIRIIQLQVKICERNYIDVVLQILMNVRKLNHVNRTAQTQKGPLNVDVL